MAKQELKQNVFIDGSWYGPDYPGNDASGVIGDLADDHPAFSEPESGNPLNPPAGGSQPVASAGGGEPEAEDEPTGRRGRRSGGDSEHE